ncbi:MAG TPA: hypothetical protein VGR65_03880 [Casimicrobiaceae bacterium]|nr:hypothetical protein [Casimicrobiaceae bacterium]
MYGELIALAAGPRYAFGHDANGVCEDRRLAGREKKQLWHAVDLALRIKKKTLALVKEDMRRSASADEPSKEVL